jgi:hypothetical protein
MPSSNEPRTLREQSAYHEPRLAGDAAKVLLCRGYLRACGKIETSGDSPNRGGLLEFLQNGGDYCVGRRKPSLAMRASSVVGFNFSTAAAPRAPRTRHPVLSNTLRM